MAPPAGVPLIGLPGLTFRALPASDVARAAEIETASYPADEAATLEKLEYRQRVAPELFDGVYEGDALVAFIVSTAARGDQLTEEAMDTHVAGGESICIHSVCVAASHRRRGVARAMVCAYVETIVANTASCGAARRMLLLAHEPLLGLYLQCGFEFLGRSHVVHGSELWYDMRLDVAAKRQLDIVQVDAFTPLALAGNPAAVLFTQRGGDEAWMQAVAVENNLSETAFLEKRSYHELEGTSAWDIRWFTPGGEVDLCGHATLGSAHALWDTSRVARGVAIAFHTRNAGILTCRGAATEGWITMDFPSQAPTAVESEGAAEARAAFAPSFGIKETDIIYLGRGPPTTPDWLLEITPGAFAALAPDSSAISRVKPMGRGVIVTCVGDPINVEGMPAAKRMRPRVLGAEGSLGAAFDFTSRFFAPTIGIDEDPVTGSAHCLLAPYWSAKLSKGDSQMRALQASARGGLLRVRLRTAGAEARVELEGQAVTVLRGRMSV